MDWTLVVVLVLAGVFFLCGNQRTRRRRKLPMSGWSGIPASIGTPRRGCGNTIFESANRISGERRTASCCLRPPTDQFSVSATSQKAAANLYRLTRSAALDHDRAKSELKALVPEDAREASGHGVRAKRSKSGAISFEVLDLEGGHAALQP